MTFASLPAPTCVADWLQAVAGGTDPTAWLEAARERALAGQPSHAWIHVCPAPDWQAQLATLAERLQGDRTAQLRRFPLLGVPFAVKDNIDIAGQPTTAACAAFAHVAERDATAVRRLLDAGAVWVGKTNLDQFATGLVRSEEHTSELQSH